MSEVPPLGAVNIQNQSDRNLDICLVDLLSWTKVLPWLARCFVTQNHLGGRPNKLLEKKGALSLDEQSACRR